MPKAYANLNTDASNKGLMTAKSVVFRDATGTPQESPLSVPAAASSVTALTIPTNAAEIELNSSVALRVGADSTLADGYAVVAAGVWKRFMVANMDTIYVAGDSATATLQFHFNLV